ncbi:hypothetical protein BC830DRAFT_147170 [Chytriomyces sp. MP71]|nr:hypothetical protein BC830DRAFT_264919 [Chytriomyces sp. MP71]KAI8616973.1 hypothetical protein BC830DRAFT_147170 [Chytriomyces sp. MP71]
MNQVNCMGMDAIYRSFIASSSAQPTTSLVTVKPIQAPQRHPPAQLKQRQLMQAASSGAAHPAGKQGTHTQPIPKPHNKTKQPPLPQTKTISTPLITLPLKGQAIPAHTPASAPVMVPAPGSAPQPIQPMPSKQEIFLQYNLMTGYLDPLHEEHWSEYFGLPVYNACGGQYLFCCPLHMAANQPDQCVHLPALTRILFEN